MKPYFNNELKRLVKIPKVYMLDSGILCHLLKITETAELATSVNKGSIYETFVMSELVKAISYAEKPVGISFYRTSDGKEIDFILDNGHSLVVIEVKAAHSVTAADFKHIRSFIDGCKKPVQRAVVLYGGERVLPFGEHGGVRLWAVPLGCLVG